MSGRHDHRLLISDFYGIQQVLSSLHDPSRSALVMPRGPKFASATFYLLGATFGRI